MRIIKSDNNLRNWKIAKGFAKKKFSLLPFYNCSLKVESVCCINTMPLK
jgi:hypothetical protein